MEEIVRGVILDIGYNGSAEGFDGHNCAVLNAIGKQSPDISMGVTEGEGLHKEQGAGDQGLMFGYANDETDVLMPALITYAHRLVEKQAEVRKAGKLTFLEPDAKSQRPAAMLTARSNPLMPWYCLPSIPPMSPRKTYVKRLWKKSSSRYCQLSG